MAGSLVHGNLSHHSSVAKDQLVGASDSLQDLKNASKATLLETANLIADEHVKGSSTLDSAAGDRIPRFQFEELKLGRILGRGGFCVVTEIDRVKIQELKRKGSSVGSNGFFSVMNRSPPSRKATLESEASNSQADSVSGRHETLQEAAVVPSRLNIAQLSRKRNKKGARFVLKQVLARGRELDEGSYLKGLVDLSLEAKFLASLDHPNIISICGMSARGPSEFIMIERLKETLSMRFKNWATIDRQCKGITGMFVGSKRKEKDLWENRMQAAYDISIACSYLHKKNIVFRDLKPDNCGFDHHDTLKLFDFGLAKELKESDRQEDGLYKLTGLTGALRYMAPEVGLRQPYNLSADVYSWSMIMWFILALEPPFSFYTESMVWNGRKEHRFNLYNLGRFGRPFILNFCILLLLQ